MPGPDEYRTVKARIPAYAQEVGWVYVPRAQAERRHGFDLLGATPKERSRGIAVLWQPAPRFVPARFGPLISTASNSGTGCARKSLTACERFWERIVAKSSPAACWSFRAIMKTKLPLSREYAEFVTGLKTRIQSARIYAARAVNQDLILLYWDIGRGTSEAYKPEPGIKSSGLCFSAEVLISVYVIRKVKLNNKVLQ